MNLRLTVGSRRPDLNIYVAGSRVIFHFFHFSNETSQNSQSKYFHKNVGLILFDSVEKRHQFFVGNF